MTAYDVLGAAPHSSHAQLRRIYLDAIRANHPDHAADAVDRDRRTNHSAELNCAWARLRNAEARHTYDAELALQRASARTSAPPPARTYAPPATRGYEPPPAAAPAQPVPVPARAVTPTGTAGLPSWGVLLAIGLLAIGPFGWLAADSVVLHAVNWMFIASLFQLAAARAQAPLAILARLAVRAAMTMLSRNGSPDSLRHSWSTSNR